MGWFCGGGGNKSTSTQTNQQSPEAQQAIKMALARLSGIEGQSFQPYTGDRYANFTPDQTGAFNSIRSFQNQPSAASESLTDETGRLGSISSYEDPYLKATLNPAFRDMRQQGAQQRIQIGNDAASAGAYGDSRHGIVEAQQRALEGRNAGDLSAKAHSDAFNTAMGLRAADRSSFAQGDQDQLQRALAQLGVGDRIQQQRQQPLDFRYQQYQQQQEFPFRQLDAALSFLTGQPVAKSTTETQTQQPNNWLAQLLGAGAGAFL